jgi:dATP pyrophosphohydrolase
MRLPREVVIAVRRGSEFLVLHRAARYDAYWHLVAGAEEAGESPAEAAARELLEETGLDAADGLVDLARTFVYALAEESPAVRERFAPETTEVVVTCFAVEASPGWEPSLNEEHDDYRWCGIDEAESLLFWPEPRELLRALA